MNENYLLSQKPIDAKNGINIFSNDDFYWGIVDRKEMDNFLELSERVGFEVAKKEFVFSKRFDYAESESRSDVLPLLPINKNSVALDVGSGFGNITIPLSRMVKEVYAVDASLPLLRFSAERARSMEIKNITWNKINSLENLPLPFKEKSFDLIILNGVLEWVGSGNNTGNPRSYQISLLKHLKELLKDDGYIVVGIENRLFPGWLKRDPHSKLPWTSILPRRIANWYAKRKEQRGYRTYIYSLLGYNKLFKKSGLKTQKTLIPFPTYRAPRIIFSPDRAEWKILKKIGLYNKMFTKKWRFFLKMAGPFKKWFLSSYIFILSKNDTVGSPVSFFNSLQTGSKRSSDYMKIGDTVKDDEFPKYISVDEPEHGFVMSHSNQPIEQRIKSF